MSESNNQVETTSEPAPYPKSRITIVETIYYQQINESPVAVDTRCSRDVETEDEQLYVRKTKATESWGSLDLGWIDEVGMIVVQNDEGKFPQRIPTPEEREEAAKKILQLAISGGQESIVFAQILPGESFRITPLEASRLSIRCESGKARYTINVYPR